jgi:hypothetical protein
MGIKYLFYYFYSNVFIEFSQIIYFLIFLIHSRKNNKDTMYLFFVLLETYDKVLFKKSCF